MELLHLSFIQYAFLGGISIALLAGIIGPFVVQSKQAVASDMFSHLALAGIGAAIFFGSNPWWWALPTLILSSTLIWWFSQRNTYSPDSLSMFFLSGGLAIALAFVHLARDTAFSFESYLFGSILTIGSGDVLVIAIATVTLALLVWKLWYPLLGATQQPSYVIPYWKTPQYIQLLFFWILAITVWIGIKTVGGLLIGALLVIPTLTVRNWARSFKGLVLRSIAISLLTMLLGLILGLYIDIPPSSMIIATMIAFFGIQELYKNFIK